MLTKWRLVFRGFTLVSVAVVLHLGFVDWQSDAFSDQEPLLLRFKTGSTPSGNRQLDRFAGAFPQRGINPVVCLIGGFAVPLVLFGVTLDQVFVYRNSQRRVRRQCLVCGHPLGASESCSECGVIDG